MRRWKRQVTLYLLTADLASVRAAAARHGQPGRATLIGILNGTRFVRWPPPARLEGNRFEMTLQYDDILGLDYARIKGEWKMQEDCALATYISTLVWQALGEPPTRPDRVSESTWDAWCSAPLTKRWVETTIEEFADVYGRR